MTGWLPMNVILFSTCFIRAWFKVIHALEQVNNDWSFCAASSDVTKQYSYHKPILRTFYC